MRTHQDIDRRSLEMARAIVARIDGDPERRGLEHARQVLVRWLARQARPAWQEWEEILTRPWEEVRALLLDQTELGQRLRQSDPFCGILTPDERRAIYRACQERL